MNHNEDIAYNSIKIMSNTDSYSKNSGSLIVTGGIGCKNTIHCEHLCSNSICIESLDANKLIIQKLLPKDEMSIIGSEDDAFHSIHADCGHFNNNLLTRILKSDNLQVKNDVKMSVDYKDRLMVNIDDDESRIDLNFDILTLNSDLDKLEITDDGLNINALVSYKYLKIDFDVTPISVLFPQKSIILLTSTSAYDISLSENRTDDDDEKVNDGTFLKIYNIGSSKFCINSYELCKGRYLEFMYVVNAWVCLNYNSNNACETQECNKDMPNEISDDESEFTIDMEKC